MEVATAANGTNSIIVVMMRKLEEEQDILHVHLEIRFSFLVVALCIIISVKFVNAQIKYSHLIQT